MFPTESFQAEQTRERPPFRGRCPLPLIPASVTLPAVKAELDAAVGNLRDRLGELVERDGLDAHQVAAHRLAWAVARAEAADSCRQWADATRNPHAALIAGTAEEE